MRQLQLLWSLVGLVLLFMVTPEWTHDLRVLGALVTGIFAMYLAVLVWQKWLSIRKRGQLDDRYQADGDKH